MNKQIVSLSELGSHKQRQDLWVAVHGKVFNLTKFAADHPGGLEVLLDVAGTDATEPFDYVGHAEEALSTMEKFIVGPLEGSEVQRTSKTMGSIRQSSTSLTQKNTRGLQKTLPALVAVALATGVTIYALKTGLLSKSAHPFHFTASLSTVHEFLPIYDAFSNSTSRTQISLGRTGGFMSGLACASTIAFLLAAYLYKQFQKTLAHEKNVFSYPPIIQRIPRK